VNPSAPTELAPWWQLCDDACAAGLAVRGAFHPSPDEFRPGVTADVGTCVLLGFTGSVQWDHFTRSPEAADGAPDPLDRWSRRVIDALAVRCNAVAVYPSGVPTVPFQRLALRCEPVHPSPIGLLIHPDWGLWHAYRGALLMRARIALPTAVRADSPCTQCAAKPCLDTCPVDAFHMGRYDVAACRRHVASEAGAQCREGGCLARRACPVGSEYRYVAAQARFHMEAFLVAGRRGGGKDA